MIPRIVPAANDRLLPNACQTAGTPMLNSVQLQVRDTARRYADDASRPRVEDLDRAGEFPEDLYREMAGLGLFEIGVPEPMGGPGFRYGDQRPDHGRAVPGICVGSRPARIDRTGLDIARAPRIRRTACSIVTGHSRGRDQGRRLLHHRVCGRQGRFGH